MVLLFALSTGTTFAQKESSTDSLSFGPQLLADTVLVEKIPREKEDHSSLKATMYALVLPGLGQAYNGKYFKIPFVYAAFGGAGYAIWFNKTNYRLAILSYEENMTDRNERAVRYYRRNLEISYIATVAIYGLQAIDAYVDAELFYWDVSRDLSLRLTPNFQPIINPLVGNSGTFGLTCSFSF